MFGGGSLTSLGANAHQLGASSQLSQTSQQDKQARKMYVGNIPPNVTEYELKDFFDQAFISKRITPEGHQTVVGVTIKADKCYAFVEVQDPEQATQGMNFDGLQLNGYVLKIRRPKDFVPLNSQGGAGGPIPDSPNKIFVGGLPSALSEDQVRELVSPFGELKHFTLVKDGHGTSKGFAFYEYADPSVTDRACAALNGKKIGDKTLLVQRAHIGAKNQPQAPGSFVVTNDPLSNLLNLNIPVSSTLNEMNILNQRMTPNSFRVPFTQFNILT